MHSVEKQTTNAGYKPFSSHFKYELLNQVFIAKVCGEPIDLLTKTIF